MHTGERPEAPGTKVNNTVAPSGSKIDPEALAEPAVRG